MKLTLNNFRSFLNQEFSFSRFNLLIGPNSSGKSSLLKFLILLQQSQEIINSNLSVGGPFIDLGSYKDIIRNYDDTLKLSFEFELDIDYIDFFTEYILPEEEVDNSDVILSIRNRLLQITDKNTISFEFDKELNKHDHLKITIENKKVGKLTLESFDPEQRKFIGESYCKLEFEDNKNEKIIFKQLVFEQRSFFRMLSSNDLYNNCIKQDINGQNLFYDIAFLVVSQNYLEEFLYKLKYVNPVKTQPLRFFYKRDIKNDPTANTLEDFLMNLHSTNYTDEERGLIFNLLNKIVQEYGIAEEFRAIDYERPRVIEARAKIKNLDSNIDEVGYGVALQIPILLSLILFKKSIVLIEQPEIHLFPKLEGKLMELLLKYGSSNTYFIETQSEYPIRKLQVVVKNKMYEIKPEDITIHYLTREEEKTIVNVHHIDEDGFLRPMFPEGFYDNSYNLSTQLLK